MSGNTKIRVNIVLFGRLIVSYSFNLKGTLERTNETVTLTFAPLILSTIDKTEIEHFVLSQSFRTATMMKYLVLNMGLNINLM